MDYLNDTMHRADSDMEVGASDNEDLPGPMELAKAADNIPDNDASDIEEYEGVW